MIDWYKHYDSHTARSIDESRFKPIYEILEDKGKNHGMSPALTCLGTTITYKEFYSLVKKFASFLQHGLHLKKGDTFAIMLPNTIQFMVAFYAAQSLGIICVNTNPLYTPHEMQHQFKDSGAKAIIILDMFLDKLEQIIEDTNIEFVIATSITDHMSFFKKYIAKALLRIKTPPKKTNLKPIKYLDIINSYKYPPAKHPSIDLNDVALIQYTGGTTGTPKGAMITHKNLMANTLQIKEWTNSIDLNDHENVLTALPLYHVYALTTNAIGFIYMGWHLILVPRPVPIENTVRIFKKFDITVFTTINTLVNALNNNADFKKIAPRNFKIIISGGMSLQQSVAKAWYDITGTTVIEGYGLTEASPLVMAKVLGTTKPYGSIGIPFPSTQVKIVDESGREVEQGQAGELLVKGPQVMKGYWNNKAETQSTIVDGWLHTGDMVRQDENGYFYIVDRKKDVIIVSGFNVYPNEVEAALDRHPKVAEVAVIGVPHPISTEVPKAFIVRRDPTLSETELKEFCKKYLTNYKRPKAYEFLDSLPKNNVGKVLRKDLKNIQSNNTLAN